MCRLVLDREGHCTYNQSWGTVKCVCGDFKCSLFVMQMQANKSIPIYVSLPRPDCQQEKNEILARMILIGSGSWDGYIILLPPCDKVPISIFIFLTRYVYMWEVAQVSGMWVASLYVILYSSLHSFFFFVELIVIVSWVFDEENPHLSFFICSIHYVHYRQYIFLQNVSSLSFEKLYGSGCSLSDH